MGSDCADRCHRVKGICSGWGWASFGGHRTVPSVALLFYSRGSDSFIDGAGCPMVCEAKYAKWFGKGVTTWANRCLLGHERKSC
jgi:hypothetical protein